MILLGRFEFGLVAIYPRSTSAAVHFPLPLPDAVPLMTDIPRLRAGRVGAQFWSVWIPTDTQGPAAVQMTIEQIDSVKRMCARYPDDLAMAYTAADIVRIHKAAQDRSTDRRRRRPPNQQLPGGAAHVLRPRRALYDADALPQYRVGRLGDR